MYKQEPFDADLFVNAVLERCGGGADIDANGAKLLVMDADGGRAPREPRGYSTSAGSRTWSR